MADVNITIPTLTVTTTKILISTIDTNSINIITPILKNSNKLLNMTIDSNSSFIESPIMNIFGIDFGKPTLEANSIIVTISNNRMEIEYSILTPYVEVSCEEGVIETVGGLTESVSGGSTTKIKINFETPSSGVSDYGVVWSNSSFPAPTIDDNKESKGIPLEANVEVEVTTIDDDKTYYARPYVIKDGVTTYGSVFPFGTMEVWTADDLNNIKKNCYGTYLQKANIDMVNINYEAVVLWGGSYDGQNYSINNLTINTKKSNQGLFGTSSEGAEVKNVNIVDCNIIGALSTGALMGYNYRTANITNCHSSGYVEAVDGVSGGLLGYNHTSIISNCSSSCTVVSNSTDRWSAGGLVGRGAGTFIECFATGDVTSIGGSAGGFVGGLPGSYSVEFNNCYARGNVIGNIYVGGFIGEFDPYLERSYLIQDCYSTGNVNGQIDYGGFCGNLGIYPIIQNSYYDFETSGQLDEGKGIPKTTSEMKTQSTYIDWDFTNIWHINGTTNNGYPFFRPAIISTIINCNSVKSLITPFYKGLITA